MDLLDFYTDGPKSREGVWVAVPGGAELKIRRMDNPDYKAFVQRVRAERGRRIASDEETREVLREAVAATILLDWRGVEFDGEPVDYSAEYAIRAFEALPAFLDQVVNLAYTAELFREDEIDDAVKSLRPTSGG